MLTFTGKVADVAANVRGATLGNTATFSWRDAPGGEAAVRQRHRDT